MTDARSVVKPLCRLRCPPGRHGTISPFAASVAFTGYPVIDLEAGGSIQAVVEGLNRLLEITVPAANAAGGTLVVPGHGRIGDQAEVAYYRDMITIIRDRIHDMIRKGMTLEQVKAARPTKDYDPRYGRETGAWTTNMFLEAAYRSLSR